MKIWWLTKSFIIGYKRQIWDMFRAEDFRCIHYWVNKTEYLKKRTFVKLVTIWKFCKIPKKWMIYHFYPYTKSHIHHLLKNWWLMPKMVEEIYMPTKMDPRWFSWLEKFQLRSKEINIIFEMLILWFFF